MANFEKKVRIWPIKLNGFHRDHPPALAIPDPSPLEAPLADFRNSDIEIFLPLQVFYPSDRARRDEQKTLYNLPSRGHLEFSRNF